MLFWGKAGPWGSTNNNPSDIFVTQLVLAGDLSQAELRPIRSQDSPPFYQYQALRLFRLLSQAVNWICLVTKIILSSSILNYSKLFSHRLLLHLSLLSTEASESSQLRGCHGLPSCGFFPPGLLLCGPYSIRLPLMTVTTTIWGMGYLTCITHWSQIDIHIHICRLTHSKPVPTLSFHMRKPKLSEGENLIKLIELLRDRVRIQSQASLTHMWPGLSFYSKFLFHRGTSDWYSLGQMTPFARENKISWGTVLLM